MVEWQPIKKAPRDGTAFLAYTAGGYLALIEWCSRRRCWIDYWDGDRHGDKPTHWMPTPEPPK